MGRKGKTKGDPIAGQVPAPPDDEWRDVDPARAPTTLCTSHVALEAVPPFTCAKCGKPFPGLAKGIFVDRTDAYDARVDTARAADDGPVPYVETEETTAEEPVAATLVEHLGGYLFVIEDVWYQRLKRMAQYADVTPDKYLEQLIRRQWVAMPAAKRGP